MLRNFIWKSNNPDILKRKRVTYIPLRPTLVESEKFRFFFAPLWRNEGSTPIEFNHSSLFHYFFIKKIHFLDSIRSTPIGLSKNIFCKLFCFLNYFHFFVNLPSIEIIDIKYSNEQNQKHACKKSEYERSVCRCFKSRK